MRLIHVYLLDIQLILLIYIVLCYVNSGTGKQEYNMIRENGMLCITVQFFSFGYHLLHKNKYVCIGFLYTHLRERFKSMYY
jgi:hypothetical protein